MSAWRRVALEQLPECQRTIADAENPMAMWIELHYRCKDAYARGEREFIGRMFAYARWCWRSPNANLATAVACAFYEHLPLTPSIRNDLPHRLSHDEFDELRDVFRYHLSPDEFVEFAKLFEGHRKGRR